jgi:tRNA nucleotidyltransferase/poly(A) polymerase
MPTGTGQLEEGEMDHNHISENAQEVFKKLEEAGIDPVLFGLTDKDYQVLARNFAQIRQKLQETNNLLEEYKKYYEETEENKQ